MPFQLKVRPVDAEGAAAVRTDAAAKPAGKSRLKRLFERQFPGVLRASSGDKLAGAGDGKEKERDFGGDGEMEPSSVCLDRMVLSFMEEGHSNEKPSRGRCNCFNGHYDESSDDELDLRAAGDGPAVSADAIDVVKGLVLCASVAERNLLADASKLVAEKTKSSKGRDDCRKFVVDGLHALGYDASVCKSRWDKNPSFSSGEYEFIDVVIANGDRLIVDVDFSSEFEVARSTKTYRSILQQLPVVFVGKPERLRQIVSVVCEAARQSMRKKGLHVPPWRKPEYMRAKWLSPYQRTTAMAGVKEESVSGGPESGGIVVSPAVLPSEFDFRFADIFGNGDDNKGAGGDAAAEKTAVSVSPWRSLSARPEAGEKVVTGLGAVF